MSHKEQMNSIIKSLSAVGKPEGASLQPEKKAAQIFQRDQTSCEIPFRLMYVQS